MQRVGRDFGCVRLCLGGFVLLLGLGLDDLDVELVELLVELVDLNRVQLQLVQRERDLLLHQEACLLSLADERLGGVIVQRHAFPSMPSPLLQADPSSDRMDGPRFVNGLSVPDPTFVSRDSCTATGQFAMGRPDYLLDARSQCLQDGKEAILLPGCRDFQAW